MDSLIPRGIKNNNPGNVRYNTAVLWTGLDDPASDGSFCRFRTPQFGIRVMAYIQLNYQSAGYETIGQRIDRWAPPTENDDASYENDVCTRMNTLIGEGFRTFTRLDVTDIDVMRAMLKAITIHENGYCPYNDDIFDEGIRMAYNDHPLLAGITTKATS